jgi:hypothetical protein
MGGVDVYINIFLILALAGDEWSASRSGRFTSGERSPSTQWIGGWVGPGASVGDLEKKTFLILLVLELLPLGHLAHSQSLYRLSYPVSLTGVGSEM